MLNMEKQIEEMAKDIASTQIGTVKPDLTTTELGEVYKGEFILRIAKHLYNAGYRKQVEGENISECHPSDEFVCSECGVIMRECCRYEISEYDDEICYEFPFKYCPRCGMKVKEDE